jgi:MarR family transcriptional regulator, organic hydroperoxide resistance regulator
MSKSPRRKPEVAPRRTGGDHHSASTGRPTLVREAEGILAVVRLLWRDLLRNPYADAEAFGMTGPQVTVMACLVGRGPITLTELSRTLGMSHSTASGIIDRLEARGLVRRAEDATDRRRTSISVTEGVTRYVRELQEGASGRLVRALETATPAQRAAVREGLRSLCDLLGITRPPA